MDEFSKIITVLSMAFFLVISGYILIECANYELTLEKTKVIEIFSEIYDISVNTNKKIISFIKNINIYINKDDIAEIKERIKIIIDIFNPKGINDNSFYTF